jgi:hypothetical protein
MLSVPASCPPQDVPRIVERGMKLSDGSQFFNVDKLFKLMDHLNPGSLVAGINNTTDVFDTRPDAFDARHAAKTISVASLLALPDKPPRDAPDTPPYIEGRLCHMDPGDMEKPWLLDKGIRKHVKRPAPLPPSARHPADYPYFGFAADTRENNGNESATLLDPIKKQQRDDIEPAIHSAIHHLLDLHVLLYMIIGANGLGTHGHADWAIALNVAFIFLYQGEKVMPGIRLIMLHQLGPLCDLVPTHRQHPC